MRLNSKQIAQCTGATFLVEPIDASEILTGVTWDSRQVKPGDLYVAFAGERVDGHEYVESALRAGARGALVNESPGKSACILARELGAAVMEVSDTRHAFEDIARKWRSQLSAKVIAVTGSVGKTTTKNLIRDVCSTHFSTVATEANQNNELGVPNTILKADPDTEVIVVEMGMRGLGQIRALCEIARPDWGVVTNVGASHMELLGTQDNIARAKAELYEALPAGSGIAFANADDPYSPKMLDESFVDGLRVRVACYGSEAAVDGFASCDGQEPAGDAPCLTEPPIGSAFFRNASLDAEGRANFTLCIRGFDDGETPEPTLFDMEPWVRTADCRLALQGEHNISNACAAAAVGAALGIDVADIAAALEDALCESGRLETVQARDGFLIINDAYNANPDSMRAALKMLSSMRVLGRRIAVLGDMGELGDTEVACHKGVGRDAARFDIDKLICIGELSRHIVGGALEGGMPEDSVMHASSMGDVFAALEGCLQPGDVVLVKASHFMRLDRLVEGLVS